MLHVTEFCNKHTAKVLRTFAENEVCFNVIRDENDDEQKTLLIPVEQGQLGAVVVAEPLASFSIFDSFRIKLSKTGEYIICLAQFAHETEFANA